MTHPLVTDPITDTLTNTMTRYLFSSLSDAHSAHLLIHYYTMTHSLILYLDTESPVYKLALSIPKISDLTWLLSCTKNPPVLSC